MLSIPGHLRPSAPRECCWDSLFLWEEKAGHPNPPAPDNYRKSSSPVSELQFNFTMKPGTRDALRAPRSLKLWSERLLRCPQLKCAAATVFFSVPCTHSSSVFGFSTGGAASVPAPRSTPWGPGCPPRRQPLVTPASLPHPTPPFVSLFQSCPLSESQRVWLLSLSKVHLSSSCTRWVHRLFFFINDSRATTVHPFPAEVHLQGHLVASGFQ